MTWRGTKTFIAGETATSADLNKYVRDNLNVLWGCANIQANTASMAGGSTSSSSFVNYWPGALTFVKNDDWTACWARWTWAGYFTAGGPAVQTAVRLNGIDFAGPTFSFNQVSEHIQFGFARQLYNASPDGGNLPAGSYTVDLRVRVTNGQSVSWNSDDYPTIELRELMTTVQNPGL